jgi:L-threonylcarbamoyladenylate synthase
MAMQTQVLPVDPEAPAADVIAAAGDVLRGGGLVAFPTETVYGLGANALDPAAVAGIFAAKGRPGHNPLIVHVADAAGAALLAADWPAVAQRLAERFWPGPLTLVVPKSQRVPDLVTAGGPTVALRVPAHPVALALLRATGLPLAAPSANRSSELSPTRAEHVLRGLDGRIPLILDAGPTSGGIESTVLDVTASPPRLLRPGLVTAGQLETVIGPVEAPEMAAGQPPRSPGLLARHYAPRTPLECVEGDGWERVRELRDLGLGVGWLALGATPDHDPGIGVTLVMPSEPARYAAELYTALHALDCAGLDRIVAALPPRDGDWFAVHDRLRRASASAAGE